MRHRSSSQLQGVSGTAQDGVFIQAKAKRRQLMSTWTNRGAACGAYPRKAAPLWAWLLMGALVVPGALSFLSEEQEELLVELHNHYRGVVSPSASAMLPLKWDPTLKLIAENYAAQCIWNHNPELEDTGENLYAATGPLDLREALEKWFLEHLDYKFGNNSCDEDMMCGHYTQMVWADTHRVGCAFHLCNNMEGLGWEKVSYLVCNYYPAGNYEDERPYVEGEWCSRCPENLQKCENNLCVPDIEEEEEEIDEDVTDDDIELIPYSTTSALPILPEEKNEEEDTVASPLSTDDPILILDSTSSPSTVSTTTPTTARPPTTHTDKPESDTATAVLAADVEVELTSKEEEEDKARKGVKKVNGRKEIERDIGAKDGFDKVARGINKIQTDSSTAPALLPALFLTCLSAVLTLEL